MYRLFFNLYGGHDPKVTVLIHRDIDDKEADILNKTASEKNIVKGGKIAFKLSEEDKSVVDRELYTFIYTGRQDKKITKLVKYCFLKKEEANSQKSDIEASKDITFEPSTVEDITSFLKQDAVRNIGKARPMTSIFDVTEAVKKSNFLLNQQANRDKQKDFQKKEI